MTEHLTLLQYSTTPWWQLSQCFWLQGRQEHNSMRVEDSSFRKNETGTSCILYAEGTTKTRQSDLHQKSRLQLPKMFERCPVKLIQKYLLKCPVGTQKSGSLYLEPFVNPLTSLWFIRHLWESTISIL